MIVDIINKKRLGQELSYQELNTIFSRYMTGEVKDYQMSSLLMAICIRGMTDEETFSLTKIFVESGEILDFSEVSGIKVDKHSTGGIGDKTTLIIAPIVASLGVPVVKMSGRGLGYTGGTIDKLESIPGFRIDLSDSEMIDQVKKIGIAITGQTANLAPMDKVIYALRDVTATVSSVPLIASSIMSKKIASGADKILIDIKVGCGALLQTMEEAQKLSELVVKIGKYYDREVRTVISDMNIPLGFAIGNRLEVLEAIDVLQGKEKESNLVSLCFELASEMVSMGKNISKEEAKKLVIESVSSLRAYNKFLELVTEQGGDVSNLSIHKNVEQILAPQDGTIVSIDALALGKLSMSLGAGRVQKEDKIDYEVGIVLKTHIGALVKKGDVLADIYCNEKVDLQALMNIFSIK